VGNPRRDRLGDEAAYHTELAAALDRGWAALEAGGALDAVVAAVEVLEDAPLFNAGRGSVLTTDGAVEMDAAVMDSARRVGAACAVRRVRHPVRLARAVMEQTGHVLLAGAGAERLAEEGELMDPAWFVTEQERARLTSSPAAGDGPAGTVGAVALDAGGRLAAATSTGGRRGQLPGRVGDSPIPGAGTWADETCAISATGAGEAMLRSAATHEVSALIRHRGLSLAEACGVTLHHRVAPLSEEAGLIAVDSRGEVALPLLTRLMHRGVRRAGETARTAIWAEDPL
jgi:beta-aspartyl-peptidase (threonine type)